MALIYTARLDPDKPEWIRRRLVAHGLPADVTAEKVGSYRFDDPAGEIGVESMVVRVGDRLYQTAFAYRGDAPAEGDVVAEVEHSVLGHRWVVDAATDPDARRILAAAVRGEIPQARLEMHDESGTYLETRAPDLTLRVIGADATGELEVPVELSETDEADVDGPRCLVAEGDGVRAVVARLS